MTGVRAAVLAWPANPMYHHCHDRLLQRPTSLALCLALPLVRGCRPGLFGRAASLFTFQSHSGGLLGCIVLRELLGCLVYAAVSGLSWWQLLWRE